MKAWWLALAFVIVWIAGTVASMGWFLGQRGNRQDDGAALIRAGDGRCWRAHAHVERDGDALSWRTDGSGLLVRVRGADWIEVARGGGVGGQGLDWRSAAATLGVDLGACLPVAESAP